MNYECFDLNMLCSCLEIKQLTDKSEKLNSTDYALSNLCTMMKNFQKENFSKMIDEKGEPELHLAVVKNMKLTAIRLIKLGSDVNAVCKSNETPLHKAIKNGHHNMVSHVLLRVSEM